MTPEIDLVFFSGCPHVDAMRDALRRALAEAELAPRWREWSSDDPDLPAYAAGYGSPSVFIGGRELMGERPVGSPRSCRLYRSPDGSSRTVPLVSTIVSALIRRGG